MSDASRLARQSFMNKPSGASYAHYQPTAGELSSISMTMSDAVVGSAYAAALSYAEALSGIQKGSVSWSVIKLYYSCFYSLRAILFLNKIVPFNGGVEMLLDVQAAKFIKGGRSSHHWDWSSFKKIGRISGNWIVSSDSRESYERLREHRENVNYTHGFTDPLLHSCLMTGEADLSKRFRAYRDDVGFLYTYLEDHLAVAYPTKLIFWLDHLMKSELISLSSDNVSHLNKVWSLRDRCPVT